VAVIFCADVSIVTVEQSSRHTFVEKTVVVECTFIVIVTWREVDFECALAGWLIFYINLECAIHFTITIIVEEITTDFLVAGEHVRIFVVAIGSF